MTTQYWRSPVSIVSTDINAVHGRIEAIGAKQLTAVTWYRSGDGYFSFVDDKGRIVEVVSRSRAAEFTRAIQYSYL